MKANRPKHVTESTVVWLAFIFGYILMIIGVWRRGALNIGESIASVSLVFMVMLLNCHLKNFGINPFNPKDTWNQKYYKSVKTTLFAIYPSLFYIYFLF